MSKKRYVLVPLEDVTGTLSMTVHVGRLKEVDATVLVNSYDSSPIVTIGGRKYKVPMSEIASQAVWAHLESPPAETQRIIDAIDALGKAATWLTDTTYALEEGNTEAEGKILEQAEELQTVARKLKDLLTWTEYSDE